MQHQCVSARFYFWDGIKGYTVEYVYSLSTWYVFEENGSYGALWHKKINPAKSKTPNRTEAEYILIAFLNK